MRRAVLALALVACSAKKAPEEPPTRVPIVPDAVMAQLGEIGFALAVDLHRLDLAKVQSIIPDELGCLRDIMRAAKIAVISVGTGDTWEGRLTGVTELAAHDCLVATAKAFGVAPTLEADNSTTLAIPDNAVSLLWHGDELVITQKGARVRYGAPPGVITDLLAQVPRTAKGWLVGSGFPKYKIKSTGAWLDTTDTTWTFTIIAESTEAGAARPWMDSVAGGFRSAAELKKIAVDATWFAIDSTPTTAKLVATIPIAAFVPGTVSP
jgi:hypothetical protein